MKFLASLLLSSSFSHAFPCIPIHNNLRDLIEPVHYVGKDDRQTYEEFAADPRNNTTVEKVYEEFSAEGRIECGTSWYSGQLTVKNDVITTAAHTFYNKLGNANFKKGDPKGRCFFEVQRRSGGKRERYEIDLDSIVVGSKNPIKGPQTNDWAVAKLKKPVKGIKPFKIPTGENGVSVAQMLAQRKRVLTTSGSQHDHDAGRPLDPPNLIHWCTPMEMDLVNQGMLLTECDLGEWGSGSALLIPNGGDHILMGIGVYSSREQNSGQPYDLGTSNSSYRPLEGEFLEQVKRYTSP